MQENDDRYQKGCFVYQALSPLTVSMALNVSDDHATDDALETSELVSVDLIVPSRIPNSTNGPFLRLSDRSGWLYERKYSEIVMKQLQVQDGLWGFFVDNYPVGIALRRHPEDRQDLIMDPAPDYRPMQKIYCDKKVTSVSGVSFYRVQGTNGWVFDKRGDTHMLLPESKVQEGLFAYRALAPVSVRNRTNVLDDSKTSTLVEENEIVTVDLIRESPRGPANGPFLRLGDGSGWLFEKKFSKQIMQEIPVQTGSWAFSVKNGPAGIALRRQPIDGTEWLSGVKFSPDDIIVCDKKISPSLNLSFYRVQGTDGWVFDRRSSHVMIDNILVEEGVWAFLVANFPVGIGLRKQPIDRAEFLTGTTYNTHELIICDRKISSPAGVNFFRVKGTDGWVFDRRGEHAMLHRTTCEESEINALSQRTDDFWTPDFIRDIAAMLQPTAWDITPSNKGDSDSWSPDIIRKIASTSDGAQEVCCNTESRVITFRTKHNSRVNVYYTTKTIGETTDPPSETKAELFSRNCTEEDLKAKLNKHQANTSDGEQQGHPKNGDDGEEGEEMFAPGKDGVDQKETVLIKDSSEHKELAQSESAEESVGEEEALRNSLKALEEEIMVLAERRLQILHHIKSLDDDRAVQAEKMHEQKVLRNHEREMNASIFLF